ncbi:MAG: hypothetical protein MHMPM18_000932 [Marteilia pararefringens]
MNSSSNNNGKSQQSPRHNNNRRANETSLAEMSATNVYRKKNAGLQRENERLKRKYRQLLDYRSALRVRCESLEYIRDDYEAQMRQLSENMPMFNLEETARQIEACNQDCLDEINQLYLRIEGIKNLAEESSKNYSKFFEKVHKLNKCGVDLHINENQSVSDDLFPKKSLSSQKQQLMIIEEANGGAAVERKCVEKEKMKFNPRRKVLKRRISVLKEIECKNSCDEVAEIKEKLSVPTFDEK